MFKIKPIQSKDAALKLSQEGKTILLSREPKIVNKNYDDSYLQSFGTLSWVDDKPKIQIFAWSFELKDDSKFYFYELIK